METITDIIKPVRLLRGSHDDTAKTGNGCFMNVVAYLNADEEITDNSPCVCATVRPIVRWFNDYLENSERAQLLPFIERALGSATTDAVEMRRRVGLMVSFARAMTDAAKESGGDPMAIQRSGSGATAAAHNPGDCPHLASICAGNAAIYAGRAGVASDKLKVLTFAYLDAVLPQADAPSEELIERAWQLQALPW